MELHFGASPSAQVRRASPDALRIMPRITLAQSSAIIHFHVIAGRITTVGGGADAAVFRIGDTFEVRGKPQDLASCDNATGDSTSVVNEVHLADWLA